MVRLKIIALLVLLLDILILITLIKVAYQIAHWLIYIYLEKIIVV
jgi:hypothetical protein